VFCNVVFVTLATHMDRGKSVFLIVFGSAWQISNRNVAGSHLLWVQGPEREIQYARNTDPRQIGQQKYR
jgi:hypothetical protein